MSCLSRLWSRNRAKRKRLLSLETLENRRLLAGLWQNPDNAFDVDGSGLVTPVDALIIINELREHGSHQLPSGPAPPAPSPPYLDVDGNGAVWPVDALMVVNALRYSSEPMAMTLFLSAESDPNGNAVVLTPTVMVQGQTLAETTIDFLVRPENTPASGMSVGGTLPAGGSSGRLTAENDGSFQFPIALVPGRSTVQITATDVLGRQQTLERTVTLGDTILDWNAALLNVVRDWTTTSDDPFPNRIVTAAPPQVARDLAMVHIAMFDAINSLSSSHEPYAIKLPAADGLSPVAAAAAAAHRVASDLYTEPDELAVWDAALLEALATVPDGTSEQAAVALGRDVGDAVLALRAADGSSATKDYIYGSEPGDWNRTFPDYVPPFLVHWPGVTPFAMTSPDQFRAPPPPSLESPEYAQDLVEVMELGRFNSTTRTADQTEIAVFWADGGGTATPPGHWNQIAADVAGQFGTRLAENGRLFAQLNIALADAGISAWDTKYAYDFWRPIDAIRRADEDGNAATSMDPTWIPLIKTPPFPTYTSGHSTFSGAAAAVLAAHFGDDVRFSTRFDAHSGFSQRPLSAGLITTRSFTSFSQAALEAGRSRIYGGIHFEFDNAPGLTAGRAVGEHVMQNYLRPRP